MLIDLPERAIAVLLAAFVFDAMFGDPAWLYRRRLHPVMLMGALINYLDAGLWRIGDAPAKKRLKGQILLGLVLAVVLAISIALIVLIRVTTGLLFAFVLEAVLMSFLLARRSLFEHVLDVAHGLNRSLADGRKYVARIVGRDPNTLDRHGVARAAIESAAENYSDGIIAPACCALLFGLPGIALYKAINTLDSMIGYKNTRYLDFGRAAAQLDDAVNHVPARLSGYLVVLAARFHNEAEPSRALAAMKRDAAKHTSPNAGWPEAATAGALGLRLAGPRHYGETVTEGAWMGNGTANATRQDIRTAVRLLDTAVTCFAATLFLALALIYVFRAAG